MTTEPKEGASVADVLGGTGDSAQSDLSKEAASKAELADLEKRIASQIEQGFAGLKQSQKDVVGDRVQKAVASLPELQAFRRIAETNPGIFKEGVDPQAILRQGVVDAIVDRELSGASTERKAESQNADPAGAKVAVKDEVDRILQLYGVASDDPEVLALAKEVSGEPLLVQLNKLDELGADIQRRKGGTSAQIGAARGKGASGPAELEAKYREEMRSKRGQGMHVAREIKERFRKAGLDVDHIDLLHG
jgi:hypothetical protein